MTGTVNEHGQFVISCDEPGCDDHFHARPMQLPKDTGNLAAAINAGWELDPDESEPDFCPTHNGR